MNDENGQNYVKAQERERQVQRELDEKAATKIKENKEKTEKEYKYSLVLRNIESAKKNVEIFEEQVRKHRDEIVDLQIMKKELEIELGK